MMSCRSCWCLLLFVGFSQPVFIEIPQSSVNGTVGQSVLLSVSYKIKGSFLSTLSVKWYFTNFPNPLTSYTGTNCSEGDEGIPPCCSGFHFTHAAYQNRAVVFHENASLLLQNLQLSDSGVYRVEVQQQTRNITLTVSAPHGDMDAETEPKNQSPDLLLGLQITGGFSLFLLLLLLVFCCRWHKGAGQQKTMTIIKQEEVPNAEEFHMENSLPLSTSTIYAKLGEDLGQRQPRSESQTEYASIIFS